MRPRQPDTTALPRHAQGQPGPRRLLPRAPSRAGAGGDRGRGRAPGRHGPGPQGHRRHRGPGLGGGGQGLGLPGPRQGAASTRRWPWWTRSAAGPAASASRSASSRRPELVETGAGASRARRSTRRCARAAAPAPAGVPSGAITCAALHRPPGQRHDRRLLRRGGAVDVITRDQGQGAEAKRPSWNPRIVVFACNWCSYAGADTAGVSRIQHQPHFRMIRVMCSGRIQPGFVLRAFEKGADGVLVSGCHFGDCHYIFGNERAVEQFEKTKSRGRAPGPRGGAAPAGVDQRRRRRPLRPGHQRVHRAGPRAGAEPVGRQRPARAAPDDVMEEISMTGTRGESANGTRSLGLLRLRQVHRHLPDLARRRPHYSPRRHVLAANLGPDGRRSSQNGSLCSSA